MLEGEKRSLEAKLEGFSSFSQEEREKAEIIAGEKKALSQVLWSQDCHVTLSSIMCIGGRYEEKN